MVRKDEVVGSIDKIPEGSQFEKYLKEIETILSGEVTNSKLDEFEKFLKQVFHDCIKFVNASGIPRLAIKILLIYNNEQYLRIEEEASKKAINLEAAIGPSTAFVLDNGVLPTIHVNVGRLLSAKNKPSLLLMYVDSLIHEILHINFPFKPEQEIYDLENTYVEKFLGIELPVEFKQLKASDYYKSQ